MRLDYDTGRKFLRKKSHFDKDFINDNAYIKAMQKYFYIGGLAFENFWLIRVSDLKSETNRNQNFHTRKSFTKS